MPVLPEREQCCGCTACMNVCPKQCIKMENDKYGFAYPVVWKSSECIQCGACTNRCPVISENDVEHNCPEAFAAYSINEQIRMKSSSGGVFTEAAKYVLEQQGVVYGAAFNENFVVHHIRVEKIEELSKLRGAKYSESFLGNTYSEILKTLKNDQYVLFSGTPCQVAGLKSFLKRDYDHLLCIDFVCHGVPSPKVWEEYVKLRRKEDAAGSKTVQINLRDKSTGWSRYRYSSYFKYEDGHERKLMNTQNLFMKLFIGDYVSRNSCENCQFKGYHRVSDLTLGDFWGIWDIIPEMDDDKGTSLVLLQSLRGKEVWNEIKKRLIIKEVTLEQASCQNPSMIKSSEANRDRQKVLEQICNGKIELCEKLFDEKKSFMNRIIRWKSERKNR